MIETRQDGATMYATCMCCGKEKELSEFRIMTYQKMQLVCCRCNHTGSGQYQINKVGWNVNNSFLHAMLPYQNLNQEELDEILGTCDKTITNIIKKWARKESK